MKKTTKNHYPGSCDGCHRAKHCLVRTAETEVLEELDFTPNSFSFSEDTPIPLAFGEEPGLHLVREGHVRVTLANPGSKTVKIVGPGSVIGLVEAQSPRFRAEAMTNVETCFLPQRTFEQMLERSNSLRKAAMQALYAETYNCYRRIAGLAHFSARERVLCLLRELARDFGVPSRHGQKIQLRLNRSTLAELTGTVTGTLARVITELEREKLIVREKWDIHLAGKLARRNRDS